jgi:predicted alpha/beta-fold hydrolase
VKDFEPHPLLRQADRMTLAATFWPRPRLAVPAEDRLFTVEPGTRILGRCHWQPEPKSRATLVLVHGLEGSSESPYMLGTAGQALAAGMNVIRMNQRNCGGTEELTPTLYNSGLSADYAVVVRELAAEGFPEIFVAGYSMGGNLVLKMAGEMGGEAPVALRGVAAVCPSVDLAACVAAIESPRNRLYHWHFVRELKQRMRRKARLFPEIYASDGLERLDRIRSIREFDDAITAPRAGCRDADDYYYRASALRVAGRIATPTLILAAKDDPMVPVASVLQPPVTENPSITLVTPDYGGHCGFVSRHRTERFWAEARVVEWSAGLARRI